jgi:hypothetical protein
MDNYLMLIPHDDHYTICIDLTKLTPATAPPDQPLQRHHPAAQRLL